MPRPLLGLALALHVLFAAGYAVTTPAFEAPDENCHYEYAWQLGNAGRLPLGAALAATRGLPQTEGAQLGHHPPLYYALLGGLLAATGTDDTVFGPRLNEPFGVPDARSRHLKFRHGSGQGEGVLLLLRLVSVLLGAITVMLVHRLGTAVCPGTPRVADLAALLVACLPMFSFLHGVLNNDVLATTLATATTLELVRLATAERLARWPAVRLGLLLGLALLTKLTTLFLLPLLAVALVPPFARALAQDRLGATLRHLPVIVLLVGAIAGWWFVRNATLYDDWLALNVHDAAFQPVPPEHRWNVLADAFLPNVFSSLLGTFGWFSLQPHPALLWAARLVAGLALFGLLRAAFGRERAALPRPLWLLGLALLLVFAGTVKFNWTAPQPQGRLLLPAIGPAAVLLAAGLVRASAPLRWRRWLVPLLPLTAAAVFVLWFRPAFDPALAPAPPSHRTLVGDIVGAVAAPTIRWRDPAPSAADPTLRWSEPGAPADARYTLYAHDDAGRVWLATWEWSHGGLVLQGSAAPLPDAARAFLPTDRDVWLVLRRVPDTADQDPAALPTSPPLRFRWQ